MKYVRTFVLLCIALMSVSVTADKELKISGRVVASDSGTDVVWIGIFASPLEPGAEAIDWFSVQDQSFAVSRSNVEVEEVVLVALRKNAVPILKTLTADSGATEDLSLEFEEGKVLRGTLASTDGIEVPDASLMIAPREDVFPFQFPDEVQFEWTSNHDGSFAIAGLIPGRYQVQAASPYIRTEKFNVRVLEGETAHQELVLKDAYFVQGRILDKTGEGVADAEVSSYFHIAFLNDYITLTSTSLTTGDFQVGPFVLGQDLQVSARDLEGGSSYANRVYSGDHDVKLVLSKMVTVQGTVLDSATGFPLEGFMLQAHGQGWVREYPHSDSEGIISAQVDSEAWGIVIDAPDYNAYFDIPVELDSLDVYEMETIELEPGKRLTGVVYDEISRQPIEDATISSIGEGTDGLPTLRDTFIFRYLHGRVTTTTNKSGEYSIEPLPPGKSVIQVTADDYQFKEVHVDSLTARLDIGLKTWETVKAVLFGKVETVTGEAVEGSIHIYHVENNSGFGTRTNDDGTFEEQTSAGTLTVQAISELGTSETLTIAMEEGETREIVLVVDPTGHLRGTITGLQGAEGVYLSVLTKKGVVRNSGRLENGEFQIVGIGHGSFLLRARTTLNRQLDTPFELSPSAEEAYKEVSFAGNSRLYGSVNSHSESPPELEVRAIGKEQGAMVGWSETLDDGTYEIRGLSDGEYWIEVATEKFEFDTVEGGSGRRLTEVVINGDTQFHIQVESLKD